MTGFFFIMKKISVAIQGIQASFHHQVALSYFGSEVQVVECKSFAEVSKSISQSQSDFGVMALENSIAGSIIPNYALIDTYDLQIIGEYYLNIQLDLMGFAGVSIENITEIHSHPIALLQCSVFLEQFPKIKLIETTDTAAAAKNVRENKLMHVGVLASPLAAKLYELETIQSAVHTVKSNKTRFVILSKEKHVLQKISPNKVSVKFELDDTPGSLATVLNVLNTSQLNLTKIQSMPIIEKPFKYSFFVDFVFSDYAFFEKANRLLQIMTTEYKVLGEYQAGKSNLD